MTVYFHMFQTSKIWQAAVHQLNSDILLRHIRVNSEVGNSPLAIHYSEDSHTGQILNQDNGIIGEFMVELA